MLGIRTLHLAALPAVLLACAPAQPVVAPSPRGTVPLEADCCGRSQSSQVLSFAEGGDNYRSVHVDTIAPDKMAQFAGARREWIVEMKRAHGNDGRGLFMQVGKNRLYTIRSFARFGDFDTRGAVIEKSLAALPKEAGSRYDRLCDTALVFPHSSEIWSVDGDLGYAPAEGAITEQMAASGLMIIEDVRPDPRSRDRYVNAVGEMNKALAEAHYPLTRGTYQSVYGSGHLVTLWLARSNEELEKAGLPMAAIARAR